MTRANHQGLFAFDGDTFHYLFQETPELDHAAWFESIGLPSSGPEYDALLRGKVYENVDTDQIVMGYYGTAFLSNQRYTTIVNTFEIDEARVAEQMLNEPY